MKNSKNNSFSSNEMPLQKRHLYFYLISVLIVLAIRTYLKA
ncbi:MAG: hypothetical protein JWM16_2488 [Verrucomicrobiales bacterium]|nr:hypothetical protein [Verrucomicrobiales bacterium]